MSLLNVKSIWDLVTFVPTAREFILHLFRRAVRPPLSAWWLSGPPAFSHWCIRCFLAPLPVTRLLILVFPQKNTFECIFIPGLLFFFQNWLIKVVRKKNYNMQEISAEQTRHTTLSRPKTTDLKEYSRFILMHIWYLIKKKASNFMSG